MMSMFDVLDFDLSIFYLSTLFVGQRMTLQLYWVDTVQKFFDNRRSSFKMTKRLRFNASLFPPDLWRIIREYRPKRRLHLFTDSRVKYIERCSNNRDRCYYCGYLSCVGRVFSFNLNMEQMLFACL